MAYKFLFNLIEVTMGREVGEERPWEVGLKGWREGGACVTMETQSYSAFNPMPSPPLTFPTPGCFSWYPGAPVHLAGNSRVTALRHRTILRRAGCAKLQTRMSFVGESGVARAPASCMANTSRMRKLEEVSSLAAPFSGSPASLNLAPSCLPALVLGGVSQPLSYLDIFWTLNF